MSFSYLFDPNKQFQDRNGVNNVGGFLRVYIDGTDDRATTYKDFNGTLNEADIMLDTDGRAVVIVDDRLTFRIEVYERDGALQWTVTQFTARGEGDGGGSSTPVVVDGTANEIDVTERMTAGVKYYTIGLATVVKNTLLGLIASFSNLVGILNSKADKVQGATAGNLAALDANGNLTDSGSKSADFKTKQTPVADPSASGNGLDFIDSISQNANGEITPHKKSVQDGTTAQKGVVKLSNAIDSTSVTEAATPKAVKDAYDELNNKIVARAVFLSQAEWDVQSQLPGDPAKVYYVENGTGEDAYTVYVWKESTSEYVEVDESSIDLDGYWHDGPTTTGSGNVVTNITLGNDGVPQVEKGMSAEPAFSVLPVNKGGTGETTGKAATINLFSDIITDTDEPIIDNTYLVYKFLTPNNNLGIFYTRPLFKLWNYIQTKISSVLGLTASSYGGKAATAGAADTASAAASGSALETTINAKLGTSGDGSNVTSTFTKASGDTSTMASGGKLSAIFTAISSFFASLKALAFKDKASYNDLSSGVQSSLDKADSALQSHQSVTDNNPTLAWGSTSTIGKVGSTDLRVTMPSNPASYKVPFINIDSTLASLDLNTLTTQGFYYCPGFVSDSVVLSNIPSELNNSTKSWRLEVINQRSRVEQILVNASDNGQDVTRVMGIWKRHRFSDGTWTPWVNMRDASWINSGTFNTDRIADDAITADKVKDNETLPVNVSGKSSTSDSLGVKYLSYTNFDDFVPAIDEVVQYNINGAYTNGPSGADSSGYWGILQVFWRNESPYQLFFNSAKMWVRYTTTQTDGSWTNWSPWTLVNSDTTLKSNTATLYIAGYTDNNIPIYNVKDIKNGCVNHVDFSNIASANCNITFEAPTLAAGEEYDYVISLEGYTNNTGVSTGSYVENCKQVLRYDYNSNIWVGEGLFLQATDWRQICIVRGNTCEWKRVALS